MKNMVKLHNYYRSQEHAKAIELYVDFYNNKRYHESLDNLTPSDIYYGRGQRILKIRQQIKTVTINNVEIMKKKSLYKLSQTNIFL